MTAAGRPLKPSRVARAVTVVKLGGELIDQRTRLHRLARELVAEASVNPLVVIHGGGREIDTEMAKIGICKQSVDGLRITNSATLDIVVGVLAGRVNTRLVAAIGAAGGSAVGLTGADAGIAQVTRSRRYRATNGKLVDLGFVGIPGTETSPKLVTKLTSTGHIPVIASIGSDSKGQLYNVNADTLAGNIAARIGAKKLVILGTTAGVLDDAGRTIPLIDDVMLIQLIKEGKATAGMVAKLQACRTAYQAGVPHITIADGRRRGTLQHAANSRKHLSVISGVRERRQPT